MFDDKIRLFHGDCLEVMDQLIDEGVKVDSVLCDPPYGTIDNKNKHDWDDVIPFDDMWSRLKALRKDRTPIILFGTEPFSSQLRVSNIKEFKYDWIWNKLNACNFFQAKLRPLQVYEIISVFGLFSVANGCNIKPKYYPQGIIEINKKEKNYKNALGKTAFKINPNLKNQFYEGREYLQTHKNYPKNILTFSLDNPRIHPTQKPLALMKYLIRTYTKENDLILDFCMGSGTTGAAAKELNRRFIGIEKVKEYYDIAKQRIDEIPKYEAESLFSGAL
jgi:site-specific DNA-methyltransferase (adenine-specific)